MRHIVESGRSSTNRGDRNDNEKMGAGAGGCRRLRQLPARHGTSAHGPAQVSRVNRPGLEEPPAAASVIRLPKEHRKAVDRRRRIAVNYDVDYPLSPDLDTKKWIDCRFDFADRPGSQIDSLWWCIDEGNLAYRPSRVLPVTKSPRIRPWLDAGIDLLSIAVEESHKRGLEAFYTYRLNGYDGEQDAHGNDVRPISLPMKDRHPDWLIKKSWCPGGLWNFAVEGVRKYKVAILRELAQDYDFDGIDIDFARHPPCLPPARQWEHRDAMTDFVRRTRRMLQAVAEERGRPMMLSVRVPSTLLGCHFDGLDLETWAREDLVDLIAIGVHSVEVDLEGFRRITEGKNIKLYPCLDDSSHPPDGYDRPGIEFLRGFAASCFERRADGILTFNWRNASEESYAAAGVDLRGAAYHEQAYREIGDPESIRFEDKTFIVMRRFGGGWTEKWEYNQNSNIEAPLPTSLSSGDTPTMLTVYVADDVAGNAERVNSVDLRLLLDGAGAGDGVEVKLNGVLLSAPTSRDDGWGIFATTPRHFAVGRNLVSIRRRQRAAAAAGPVSIEKLEVHVAYRS